MSRSYAKSRPQTSAAAAERAASPQRGKAVQLLAMQRSVGNRAVLQMLRSSGAALEEEAAPAQRKAERPGALPLDVQAKMEKAMGADFSNVNVHTNSSQASAAGALAYAQGNDIHFAPGQYDPDTQNGQKMIGHELAHVVQQREGRVLPTTQLKSGLRINDDPALEKEADAMGERAAAIPDQSAPTIQRMADRPTPELPEHVAPFMPGQRS
ncbi:eCIS core domain-containing protein [Cohnella sp. 56]|uniref:eCIS core domain-containing protein n=1 Tax=Cohnella sp. 56 TaxID=3113722 RepID=UPI0030E97E7F